MADADWHHRKERLEFQLTDFILQQVDDVDSWDALENLEGIAREIEDQVGRLSEEYMAKVRKARELRQRQEKERSNQLLEEKIGISLFPTSVKREIMRLVLVKNEAEASIVCDAMFQFVTRLRIPGRDQDIQELTRKLWPLFVWSVKEQGWDYLRMLAEEYHKDTEKMLASIGVCPWCNAKLLRQWSAGKEILRCSNCGVSYYWDPSKESGQPID